MSIVKIKKYVTSFFVLLALAASLNCQSDAKVWSPTTYTAIEVKDGDSFVATDGQVKFQVRIAEIDAPEWDQPYGLQARLKLQELILNKAITIVPVKESVDRYNRTLGTVFVDEQNVGLLMVQEGFVHYYRPTCKDHPEDSHKYNYTPKTYVEAEKQAKAKRLGLWQQTKVQYPCDHRRKK